MEDDMQDIVVNDFITAKQMVLICLTVWAAIQAIALVMVPTEWRNWQLLGFIASTNLAAVILAILAQRSADSIGKTSSAGCSPTFWPAVSAAQPTATAICASHRPKSSIT